MRTYGLPAVVALVCGIAGAARRLLALLRLDHLVRRDVRSQKRAKKAEAETPPHEESSTRRKRNGRPRWMNCTRHRTRPTLPGDRKKVRR